MLYMLSNHDVLKQNGDEAHVDVSFSRRSINLRVPCTGAAMLTCILINKC